MSGNVAEHMAVNSVLRWLIQHQLNDRDLVVHTDNQLVVGHLSGSFQIRKENLKRIADVSKAFMARFPSVTMKWIRREQNQYADAMSKVLQPKFADQFGCKMPTEELPTELVNAWK